MQISTKSRLWDAIFREIVHLVPRHLASVAVLWAAATASMAGSLLTAIQQDDLGFVKREISNGADVNQEDPFLGSPLTVAITKGNARIVEMLLSHGAALEREDPASGTPLHTAAANGNLGIVKILIAAGADIHAIRDANGESPLHSAAEGGNGEIVELLVSLGADVNARSSERYGPIHSAAAARHFAIADFLRAQGAMPQPVSPVAPLMQSADPVEGARIFDGFCKNCHSPEKGGPIRIGPNLWGVVGRERAHIPDFEYSAAIIRHGGSWTYETLNAFIAGPTDFIPGTKMSAMISFLSIGIQS